MKIRRIAIVIVLSLACFFSCKTGPKTVPLNLKENGIDIVIQAPEDAVVSEGLLSLEQGLSIKGTDYNIEVDIYEQYAHPSGDAALVKSEELADIQKEEDFLELIQDDPHGFVYKTIDDEGENFHFLYVVFKNNKQYEFREGLKIFTPFEKEQVLNMYAAVQQKQIQ